jgi:signal transduction histidine kinase
MVKDNEIVGVVVSFIDISDRRKEKEEKERLNTQLQQAQKMESIGTLAGGIAHDFNNILSPIYGYTELAKSKAIQNPELSRDLDEILRAAERARELVKQILQFSRRDSDNLSPIEVHVVVKEALKLLRASIPTTIEIRQSIDPLSGLVLANPIKIHQILMNLCTNAYHAMRETGGVLGVSLIPLEISVRDLNQNLGLKPGQYLRLEVSDTGHGMDQATQERIFEPYFTTKAKGEGTGMGLSVIHILLGSQQKGFSFKS